MKSTVEVPTVLKPTRVFKSKPIQAYEEMMMMMMMMMMMILSLTFCFFFLVFRSLSSYQTELMKTD